MKTTIFSLLFSLLLMSSCIDKDEIITTSPFVMVFEHQVDSNDWIRHQMCYVNKANNPFEITEIMYFISRVKLFHNDGRIIELDRESPFHYVNPDYPGTLRWVSKTPVPAGLYDSLTFTFGLNKVDNTSFRFSNPPESHMAWPEMIGGGYHYMMLNGWYKDLGGVRKSSNFHLGTGQIREGELITGFIDNSFTVKPAGDIFIIIGQDTTYARCVMHIDSWFDTPTTYDFNYFGGSIMHNQQAMRTACVNGKDAFSISYFVKP